MEDKKVVVLDIIEKLSDLDFQREVWVQQKYWDRVLNFGEAVNTLDDYNFFDDVETNSMKFPNDQWRTLVYFSKKILGFEEDESAEEILQNPDWIEITKIAKDVMKILQ